MTSSPVRTSLPELLPPHTLETSSSPRPGHSSSPRPTPRPLPRSLLPVLLSPALSLTSLSRARRSSSRARALALAIDREPQLAGAAPGSNPARYGPPARPWLPAPVPLCLVVAASPFTPPRPSSTVQVPPLPSSASTAPALLRHQDQPDLDAGAPSQTSCDARRRSSSLPAHRGRQAVSAPPQPSTSPGSGWVHASPAADAAKSRCSGSPASLLDLLLLALLDHAPASSTRLGLLCFGPAAPLHPQGPTPSFVDGPSPW
ncbi:predicted GPI-anchored protein 58 [Triticum urartu]|uniref:predicted GPI-anchored protein 58 n=1 Tax=Triticum urartu TaxID=4572 RepID=UPI002043AAA1|nr:predicted GPI-anchored protein 58 [Triticum urartu]